MNLKWKVYNQTHYCYNEDNGRIVGELYVEVLTGHATAWIIPWYEAAKEKYGTWLTVKDAQVALEAEIIYRDNYNL